MTENSDEEITMYEFQMTIRGEQKYGCIKSTHMSNEKLVYIKILQYIQYCMNYVPHDITMEEITLVDYIKVIRSTRIPESYNLYIDCSHNDLDKDYFIYEAQKIFFKHTLSNKPPKYRRRSI